MTEAIVVLEWVGCVTGVLGALLLALKNDWSKWGFFAYLVSNVAWFGFGLYTGAYGLMWMQVAFMVTTLIGIYRWVLPNPQVSRENEPCAWRNPSLALTAERQKGVSNG